MVKMGIGTRTGLKGAVAGLLAAVLLFVSLIATSPGLHHAIHCDEDASVPHVCLLTLIRDGHFEYPAQWHPAPHPVELAIVFLATLPPTPDFKPPPHRLPWALSPPVIG
ncbi:MAG: hypothetical protein R3F07_05105 [Opitutaceae bacterium]